MAGDPLAPQPLRGARALDPRFYTADTMRVLDRDAVFRTTWHLVGHAGQIPEAGDHLVVETALAPVVVLRTVDGTIRAFHNVCRHRAGPHAPGDGKGAKARPCTSHGGTYTPVGALGRPPAMTP
ncbi:MAG: Rieske 2Fe-2S domain-containing protein, partial [Lysobacteraceae bacterium]